MRNKEITKFLSNYCNKLSRKMKMDNLLWTAVNCSKSPLIRELEPWLCEVAYEELRLSVRDSSESSSSLSVAEMPWYFCLFWAIVMFI